MPAVIEPPFMDLFDITSLHNAWTPWGNLFLDQILKMVEWCTSKDGIHPKCQFNLFCSSWKFLIMQRQSVFKYSLVFLKQEQTLSPTPCVLLTDKNTTMNWADLHPRHLGSHAIGWQALRVLIEAAWSRRDSCWSVGKADSDSMWSCEYLSLNSCLSC